MNLIHPDIASSSARMAIYKQALANDGSHKFAEMCALQCPPGTKATDRAFMQGAHRQMEDMDPKNRELILDIAKKAGISTQGKCHKAGLGRPEDPAAWVSSSDDVLRVAKARNLNVSGVVNHKAVDNLQEPKRVKLAEDIIQRMMKRTLERDPSLAAKVKQKPKRLCELREAIVAKHSRKK